MTEDQRRDKYYKKNYGINLVEYNSILEEQNGVCGICCVPPKEGKHLAVDHDHQWKYTKIKTERDPNGGWTSSTVYAGKPLCAPCRIKKHQAIKDVRNTMKSLSVRGLLCYPCNVSLRSLRNSSFIALKAAHYLEKHSKDKFVNRKGK